MAISNLKSELEAVLASQANVLVSDDAAFKDYLPRWRNLEDGQPGAIVVVSNESDVVHAVQYGIKHKIPFRVHSGGHGSGSIIDESGFVIDLRNFRGCKVDTESRTITVQGGAINRDVYEALTEAKHFTSLGGANAVGVASALLGGGLTANAGSIGLLSDNLVSARVVTGANGDVVTASASENAELFWGLRGGGQKLGIVTEMVIKIFSPATFGGREGAQVWTGVFAYMPDKIETIAKHWTEHGRDDCAFAFFFAALPPTFQPTVNIMLTFFGGDADMEKIVEPFKGFGPVFHEVKPVPYNHVNDGVDPFCTTDGKKTFIGTGLDRMVPETVAAVWDSWVKFRESSPDFAMSTVMVESSGHRAVQAKPKDATAFPHRNISVWAWAVPWWSDPANTPAALAWGEEVKKLNRSTSKIRPALYSNFGFAADPLEELYGASLERLRALKKTWDPNGVYGVGNYGKSA